MVKVGDKYILHSSNGIDYNIEIVNVSDFREPSMKYAVDVCDGNGVWSENVLFVDDALLSRCEKVSG